MEDGTQWYGMEDMSHPLPPSDAAGTTDADGMPLNQEAALASLDLRANTISSHAQVDRGLGGDTPEGGIGVARNWRIKSEKADSCL